jgi:bacteriocin-like protein
MHSDKNRRSLTQRGENEFDKLSEDELQGITGGFSLSDVVGSAGNSVNNALGHPTTPPSSKPGIYPIRIVQRASR